MKEPDDFICVGIEGGQISPFVQIALMTCQREIIHFITAPVLFRHDVLDMKGVKSLVILS